VSENYYSIYCPAEGRRLSRHKYTGAVVVKARSRWTTIMNSHPIASCATALYCRRDIEAYLLPQKFKTEISRTHLYCSAFG